MNNTEITTRAHTLQLRPVKVKEIRATYEISGRFNLPLLGDYLPNGWERVTDIEPLNLDTEDPVSRRRFMLWIRETIRTGDTYLAMGIISTQGTVARVAVFQEID